MADPVYSNGKKSVLLVDDDPIIRDLYLRILNRNYNCDTAASGEEALELLGARSYHLMLTDFEMPGINGAELTVRMKKLRPEMKVLLGSGNLSDKRIRKASEESGADDLFQKPIPIPELRGKIEKLLEDRV